MWLDISLFNEFCWIVKTEALGLVTLVTTAAFGLVTLAPFTLLLLNSGHFKKPLHALCSWSRFVMLPLIVSLQLTDTELETKLHCLSCRFE